MDSISYQEPCLRKVLSATGSLSRSAPPSLAVDAGRGSGTLRLRDRSPCGRSTDFDLAMLLALVGGFPTYSAAVNGLLHRKITADLAVSLAAMAALWIGWRGADPSSWFLVAAEVIFIMLVGESLEDFAIGRTRSGIAEPAGTSARIRPASAAKAANRKSTSRTFGPMTWSSCGRATGSPSTGASSAARRGSIRARLPASRCRPKRRSATRSFAGTLNTNGALEVGRRASGPRHDAGADHPSRRACRSGEGPGGASGRPLCRLFRPLGPRGGGRHVLGHPRSVAQRRGAGRGLPVRLVLATPTAVAAGIGFLVRRGILVKGGAVLENLGRLKAVVFDKTGTLTLAQLRIERIETVSRFTAAAAVRLAAAVEQHSEHPIARLLVEHAGQLGIEIPPADGFLSPARPGSDGHGRFSGRCGWEIRGRWSRPACGSPTSWARGSKSLRRDGHTLALVAVGDEVVAAVGIRDAIRPTAEAAIRDLRHLGIEHVVMLTGDQEAAARAVAEELSIAEFHFGLLPAEKADWIARFRKTLAPVAMVGDGINDAPCAGGRRRGRGPGRHRQRRDHRVGRPGARGRRLAETGRGRGLRPAGAADDPPEHHRVCHRLQSGLRGGRVERMDFAGDRRRRASGQFAGGGAEFAAAADRRSRLAAPAAAIGGTTSSGSAGAIAAAARGRRCARLPGRRTAHDRRRRARRGPAVRQAGLAARAARAALSAAVSVRLALRDPARRDASRGNRLPQLAAREALARTAGLRMERPASRRPLPARARGILRLDRRREPDRREPGGPLPGGRSGGRPLQAVGVADEELAARWDELVRAESESAFRAEMARREADDLLEKSRGRKSPPRSSAGRTRPWTAARAGLQVEQVCFGDIHPPLEVVPAFRDVSIAMEEKEARINEAQAYQYQTEATARGQAAERMFAAAGFAADRTQRATAAAARFLEVAAAYAAAPKVTALRLYLRDDGNRAGGQTESDRRRRARRPAALYLGPQGARLGPPTCRRPSSIRPPTARNSKESRHHEKAAPVCLVVVRPGCRLALPVVCRRDPVRRSSRSSAARCGP